MVTASSSRSSWASSRYFSDPERSLGRVTRAGDGAPIDDGDEARDNGPGTDDEARFCRSDPRITQECRTTVIGAISLDRNQIRYGTRATRTFTRRSGPRVRIRLPPAESLQTIGPPYVARRKLTYRHITDRILSVLL